MVAPREADRDTVVELELEFIPHSGKNRMRAWRTGARCPTCGKGRGHIQLNPSEEAAADYEQIARAAAAFRRLDGSSLFGDDDVTLELEVDERAKRTLVRVESVGMKRRKGPTDRVRDVHNTLDVVADALQGLVYDNDRQVRRAAAAYGVIGRPAQRGFEYGGDT